MKQVLHELIQELSGLLTPLATRREYGSLRECGKLLNCIVSKFAEFLLSDREDLDADELTVTRALLHNPIVRPLTVYPKLQQELQRRRGRS